MDSDTVSESGEGHKTYPCMICQTRVQPTEERIVIQWRGSKWGSARYGGTRMLGRMHIRCWEMLDSIDRR
jgi:hypothetical protein